MSRRWWDDQGYQIQLNEKIDTRTWFVVANDEIPGRVVKIIYAGYKIQLPDDSTTIVNPAKDKVLDASNEEYAIAVEAWQARKDAAQRARNAILEEEAKLKQKQKQCLHVSSKHECVTSAAGCDIYETLCLDCGKVLRRSWATAYCTIVTQMIW